MMNGSTEIFTKALYLITAAFLSCNIYYAVKPAYEPPKPNDSWSFRRTMFCKAEHTSRLIQKRQKEVEKTNIFEWFQDLKNLIRDPDSTFTWADYCKEFNSNFFDMSKRAVSLGTAEIKMKTGCNLLFSIL